MLRSRRTACAVRARTSLGEEALRRKSSFTIAEGELRALFEPYGGVDRVEVIPDRETGRPRGFAFVEMADAAGADSATRGLDGPSGGSRA